MNCREPVGRPGSLFCVHQVSLRNDLVNQLGGEFVNDAFILFVGREVLCEAPQADGGVQDVVEESNVRLRLESPLLRIDLILL